MGKHQGNRRRFQNVGALCLARLRLKKGAACDSRTAPFPFFVRLGSENSDSLRQTGHAAIHKDYRADYHCGGEQHVQRNRFPGQEPS